MHRRQWVREGRRKEGRRQYEREILWKKKILERGTGQWHQNSRKEYALKKKKRLPNVAIKKLLETVSEPL